MAWHGMAEPNSPPLKPPCRAHADPARTETPCRLLSLSPAGVRIHLRHERSKFAAGHEGGCERAHAPAPTRACAVCKAPALQSSLATSAPPLRDATAGVQPGNTPARPSTLTSVCNQTDGQQNNRLPWTLNDCLRVRPKQLRRWLPIFAIIVPARNFVATKTAAFRAR